MMPPRFIRIAGLCVLAAGVLGGCAASTSPDQDARFGDSVRSMQVQQYIDPAAAARNADAAVRSDGKSAREATGRYVESFKAPAPQQIISIGGGTATGAAAN